MSEKEKFLMTKVKTIKIYQSILGHQYQEIGTFDIDKRLIDEPK